MKLRTFLFIFAAVAVSSVCLLAVSTLAKKEISEIGPLKGASGTEGDLENFADSGRKNGRETKKDPLYGGAGSEGESVRPLVQRDFNRYVFVGDSRYKGMSLMAQEEDLFICENGRGYDFLAEQLPYIRSVCDSDTALIIGLGVNDNSAGAEKYIETLNEMTLDTDCQIYFTLLGPVDESKESYSGYDVQNENIDVFNEQIVAGLDEKIGIIDTNAYLAETGFETQDGLHYTDETYAKIYHYIKQKITG